MNITDIEFDKQQIFIRRPYQVFAYRVDTIQIEAAVLSLLSLRENIRENIVFACRANLRTINSNYTMQQIRDPQETKSTL
jgi:hypothetical protein